jgi:ABC-type polysaccharide/polyol phosphate export permease
MPNSNPLGELSRTWQMRRYIAYRAYLNQKLSVRRSKIGIYIEPIMLIVSTFLITVVWNKLFGKGGGREFQDFYLYVLCSFTIWGFISSIVRKTSSTLVRRAKFITTTQDPLLSWVAIDLASELFSFLLLLPAVIVVCLLVSDGLYLSSVFYVIYGVLLVLLSGIGFGLTVGVACFYYGDLQRLISAFMSVAFLLTPIIWQLERLGEYKSYIYFNPFYNYLAVFRDGLLLGRVGNLELIIATSTTLVLLIVGLSFLRFQYHAIRAHAFSI